MGSANEAEERHQATLFLGVVPLLFVPFAGMIQLSLLEARMFVDSQLTGRAI